MGHTSERRARASKGPKAQAPRKDDVLPQQPVGGRGSAVERVAAEVRRAILNGTLSPGASFSITELSEKLGVSHIPVREALRRLDALGLVVLRPGRSAIVGPLSADELHAIYRLRRTLEPALAARAAHLHDAKGFEKMDALLATYAAPNREPEDVWQTHHDLHLALLAPAASAWDLRILNQLWHASDRYTRIVFDAYQVDPAELRRRSDAHRGLVQAARSGSPYEIRTAIEEHLAENEAACLTRLSVFLARPAVVP